MLKIKYPRTALFILLAVIPMYFIMKSPGNFIPIVFVLGMSVFFLSILIIRNQSWFKPILLGKWNFFSDRYEETITFDLDADTLFDKFLEVLPQTDLRIRYADKKKGEIMANSKISIWSFGENVYFELVPVGEATQVKITSTALFQAVAWGKNEKNVSSFLHRFDKSLTI
ncbi:MAG: hypothetical protein KDC83_14240 [Flavobacteriales bacterium]|nr:hypothetical protein [Flavobacteriales bacterium]